MDTDGILGLLKETAAEIITPRFRQLADHQVTEKVPGDLVTIADQESEAHLTMRLREAFPGAVVVGEEAIFADPSLGQGLANADQAFIIDPIDGTRNFVHGRDEHGIILAETRGGVTTRGWIWQPQTGRAYVAERGAGARLNGAPIVRERHDRLPLGASSQRRLRGYDGGGRLSPVVRSNFACCFDYPAVLHGDLDFMWYSSLHPWDHLAGSLMVVENGGISRTMEGLNYNIQTRARGLLVAGDTMSWIAAQQNWPIN